MKSFLVLVLSLLVSNAVFAENQTEKKLVAFGFVAGKTCSQYLQEAVRSTEKDMLKLGGKYYYSDTSMYTQWVAGFLTGYSAGIRKGYPADLNIYNIMLKIEEQCEKHPNNYFSRAVNKAVMEIK